MFEITYVDLGEYLRLSTFLTAEELSYYRVKQKEKENDPMDKPVEYCEYQIKRPTHWRRHEDQLMASYIFDSGENRSIRLKVIYEDGSCRAFFDCSSVPEKILRLARKAAINSLYGFKKLYTPKETCDAIIRRGGKISYSKLSEDEMRKKDTEVMKHMFGKTYRYVPTIKEVSNTMNEDQKNILYTMVGAALEESGGKVGDNVLCIKKVIFNGPATIVIWDDGSKTVVKCMEGDIYDPEKALMMCVIERLLGVSKMEVKRFFKKWIPEEDDLDAPGNLFEVVEKAVENAKKALDDLGGKK